MYIKHVMVPRKTTITTMGESTIFGKSLKEVSFSNLHLF